MTEEVWGETFLELETMRCLVDDRTDSAWFVMRPDAPVCYTPAILSDWRTFRDALPAVAERRASEGRPLRYVAHASDRPDVYGLGGDLALFASLIRAQDGDRLREYGHACVDVLCGNLTGYGLQMISVTAVSGRCLGGGFEAALSFDHVFAEAGSMLGVPEIAFNTFPGMGAVSFLTRRIGASEASRFIMDGMTHDAATLAEPGVIDHLTPAGGVRRAALDWMAQGDEDVFGRRLATTRARRAAMNVTRAELIGIVDLWVDVSMSITEADLRHMERIVAAQSRLTRRR